MNLVDTTAFLTWLSQHDGRIQVSDAEIEIWQYTLSAIPTNAVKAAALEHYRLNEKEKPSPFAIRKIAIADRDRTAAKQSALEAAPVVRNPNSYKSSDPERWQQLMDKGRDDHRAKLRARGITPHTETCPTCRNR